MKEAGTVLHLARSGRLIISATQQVKDNTILFDESGRRICKVMEMIGPVASPYLSAQPLTERIARILGKKVFLSEETTSAQKSRRYGSRVRELKRRSSNPHEK